MLINDKYYVIEVKKGQSTQKHIAQYRQHSNTFSYGHWHICVEEVRAYSTQGYSPEELLNLSLEKEDLLLRVRILENLLREFDDSRMQEYASHFVLIDDVLDPLILNEGIPDVSEDDEDTNLLGFVSKCIQQFKNRSTFNCKSA